MERQKIQYDGSIPGMVYLPYLSNGQWNQWLKVQEAEQILTKFINDITNLPRMVDNGKEGYFPYYDAYWLDDKETKIEIKMSLKDKLYPLELSKGDGSPGGLSITTSDYYLIVNGGWLNHGTTKDKDWERVGKIHLVKTNVLREYVNEFKDIKKPYSNNLVGSQSAILMDLDFQLLYDSEGNRTDGWICDIPLLFKGDQPVGYDFRSSKVIRDNPIFRKEIEVL